MSLLLGAVTARGGGVVTNLTEQELIAKLAGGGTVTFATGGTLRVTSPITIAANTAIVGAGYSVTLSGGGSSGLFHVSSHLTLLSLTLTNGLATNGGALFIHPTATVLASNCVFAGNSAVGLNGTAGTNGASSSDVGKNGTSGGSGTGGLGGAIFNRGQLTLLACQFLTNSATGGNGAVGGDGGAGSWQGGDGGRGGNGGAALGGAVYSSGTVSVSNCTWSGNSTVGGDAADGGAAGDGPFPGHRGHGGAGGAGNGAALYCPGSAIVVGCTFDHNHGTGGNSALSGQESNGNGKTAAAGGDALGGALWCGATCNVTNSTFSANSVVGGIGGDGGDAGSTGLQGGDGGRGGYGTGGSVCNAGTLHLVNCTLVEGNSLGGLGGLGGDGPFLGNAGSHPSSQGGNVANSGGSFILKSCILAYPGSGTNSYMVTNVVATVTNHVTEIEVVSTNTLGLFSVECGSVNLPLGCYTSIVFTNGSTVTSNLFVVTNCMPLNVSTNCLTNIVFTNVVISNYTETIWVTNVVGVTNIGAGFNAYGTITDAGNNLSSDASPKFNTSRNNTDPKLGTLTNNGGPTATYALWFSSPALNAGDNAAALPFDQRGRARPTGGSCDIGAVEMGGPVIHTQPQSKTIPIGAAVEFTVGATGEATPLYLWRLNGAPISGATTTRYSLTNVQPTDAGDYTVLVVNAYGAATSQVATLTVQFALSATEPRLSNGTDFAFTFTTRSGYRYFVECKTNLTNAGWTRLSTNTGTGGPLPFLTPVTGVSSRFFRVVEE